MDKQRTAESPMDFEWQTRAPGDVTSPFYQLSVHHDKQRKRPHNVFDSPEKKQTPSLREPNSQTFLFSQPQSQNPTAAPKSVFGQPAFTTPRKFDLDFSSGAENMSSPENADNEDTPDQTPKSSKRNSLFGLYGRFAPSAGRGGIPRSNHYSDTVARRVHKRRRRNKALGRQVQVDSEDESDRPTGREEEPVDRKRSDQKPSRLSSFSDFFTLLEAHPNVPGILSWWAQLVVNLSLFSLAVYVVFGFVSAIRTEFDHAAEEASDSILAEMATCARSYVDNKCAGGSRLPALETVCENWERCMNRDPAKIGRAKVSAHTMAIIINSFIDPISWKAIMFFLATMSTVTFVSNWSFRSFRNRLSQHVYTHQPSNYQPNQPMHNPAVGYFREGPHEVPDDRNRQLMLENQQSMGFVTGRSRSRERRLRTPSPAKRGRQFS